MYDADDLRGEPEAQNVLAAGRIRRMQSARPRRTEPPSDPAADSTSSRHEKAGGAGEPRRQNLVSIIWLPGLKMADFHSAVVSQRLMTNC